MKYTVSYNDLTSLNVSDEGESAAEDKPTILRRRPTL